ncbi:Phosphoenolpyruvate synthase regulatory protein [Candidatus Syntrophocurvum alkaliphilum]|uniref:Putative pyruvate, phosphate dikinase regulatory protein n=1 Tax=Candidatus Syntrophocurvum alkaliphilum TaxID=2293317 RepID=A0A6I6DJV5_9FIRM|nr:pyruvate, water dikinase regulatory protein [Candidatus Syntrophocurvum alkaliphilum]QGT99974.1 Phosphoenolpyruvate synthase regulatory protein [Candidatus Syntrophocurvum alkaliphilum]
MANSLPGIYIVSDSIGETAEMVVRAAATQFNSGKMEVRRVPNISDTDTLQEVVHQAAENNCLIAYTLVIDNLAEFLKAEAKIHGVICIDVLGPMVDAIKSISSLEPKREPGLLRKVDEMYYRRVEAVEFAVRYDDGKDPRGIDLADIVLVGISRTSKTPLSMYLAHKRIKVANVPLVPEVTPPSELFKAVKGKVIGLTIKPEQLNYIRTERLKTLGLKAHANYADPLRIEEEIEYSNQIMRKLGCPVIDVTNKAVEETSSKILEIYYRRLSNV